MFMKTSPAAPRSLWGWGLNSNGELGIGTTANRSSPVQVGALTDWSSVVADRHGMAIKTDGTLWAWGMNQYGPCGLGDTVYRSSPVQVGALTNWSKVAVANGSSRNTLAIKTDGTLWAWGRNSQGQSGLGDVTARSSPVQVGALTTWAQVAAGYAHSLAIKTDGTLWAWGNTHRYGAPGLGYANPGFSSPVQVGALTTWSQVVCGLDWTAAIKTDGTLWTWGRNNMGQLGLGDTTNRSSPVQVGALTTWAKVSAGAIHAMAIKTDGTLWGWGYNNYCGALGLGDTTNRSSPVQVGALTTWSQVGAGLRHTVALRENGTLWTWGAGPVGQLGLGAFYYKSSPTQVGALTTWAAVAAGYKAAFAIKN